MDDTISINRPLDVYKLFENYKDSLKEHFFLITLRGKNTPIGAYIITIGTINKTVIHSREVFQRAILDSSTGIIVAHNHPSGDIYPSHEDIIITEKLRSAGKIIGIPLIDHVIIGKEMYYSFCESKKIGNINFYKEETEVNP
jgi:DNA repair protein RadC